MLLDLVRALAAGAAAVVLPGYFWATFLRPASGTAERLAYSSALSLGSVPVVALALTHITGSGVNFWIALASCGIVLGSGILALVLAGAANGRTGPVFPSPQAIRDPRAVLLLGAGSLVALVLVPHEGGSAGLLIIPVLALIVAAALLAAAKTDPPDTASATPAGDQDTPRTTAPPSITPPSHGAALPQATAVLRAAALPVVLGLTAVRAYAPVIRYDWPSVRGLDHFSHAVMTEQMLAHGQYRTYLIYPPGFPTACAVISRLSGLTPLGLFPVLAPALLVITALAAYALATLLWGRWYGVAAAALSGLVLNGAYTGFADGRYPNLVSAYFLVTMGVAALVTLYQSPSWRAVTLAAVIGASPVLYHSVATLYEAVVLVLAAVTALPYLRYRRHRADARMVLAGLVATALIATGYGWYTYGLGWPMVHHSATSTAVSLVLGSQPPPPALHLVQELAPPIIWLGVFGVALLTMGLRPRPTPPQVCASLLVLLWCGAMYLGSRTAADGFPQRFERDLGAVLSVTGALGLGVVTKSLWQAWRQRAEPGHAALNLLALGIPVLAVAAQAVQGVRAESHPAPVLSPPVVAAGDWLTRHNSGGTIVSSVLNNGITERAALAIGGYPGLMYYGRTATHPRSLPTAEREPLVESQEVLEHPASCAAAHAIATAEVRYVVLYRGASQEFDLPAFRADPDGYREVYYNSSVIIYAPTGHACAGSGPVG